MDLNRIIRVDSLSERDKPFKFWTPPVHGGFLGWSYFYPPTSISTLTLMRGYQIRHNNPPRGGRVSIGFIAVHLGSPCWGNFVIVGVMRSTESCSSCSGESRVNIVATHMPSMCHRKFTAYDVFDLIVRMRYVIHSLAACHFCERSSVALKLGQNRL